MRGGGGGGGGGGVDMIIRACIYSGIRASKDHFRRWSD